MSEKYLDKVAFNGEEYGLKDEVSRAELGTLKSAIEDLEAGSLSALGATKDQVPLADGLGSWAWGAQAGGTQTIQVSGTTPAITAVANTRYICGEVATLDIALPASGCIDVVFESGSTATVLTVTPPTGITVKWANGFDPDNLDAETTYELRIVDGARGIGIRYGASNYTHKQVLWEGTAQNGTTVLLSDDIRNYDYLICTCLVSGSSSYPYSTVIDTSMWNVGSSGNYYGTTAFESPDKYNSCSFGMRSYTSFLFQSVAETWGAGVCVKVVGIKL